VALRESRQEIVENRSVVVLYSPPFQRYLALPIGVAEDDENGHGKGDSDDEDEEEVKKDEKKNKNKKDKEKQQSDEIGADNPERDGDTPNTNAAGDLQDLFRG